MTEALPATSKAAYDRASLELDAAGARLAAARLAVKQARAELEQAEDAWSDAAAALRAHESKPGIPRYLTGAYQTTADGHLSPDCTCTHRPADPCDRGCTVHRGTETHDVFGRERPAPPMAAHDEGTSYCTAAPAHDRDGMICR